MVWPHDLIPLNQVAPPANFINHNVTAFGREVIQNIFLT